MFPEGRENTGELRDILIRRANGEEFDMREWLAIRRLRLYENAERAFANSISQTAMQLSFVKRARVDLQTSLGGRKGAGGVDVAGALRETDDDIVGWQLRAYAGEDSAKGLNSGLFYRRIVNGALAGVNVFADYEDGDDGDFWRWSIGGDVKNRFGELSANHYFAITDAQMVGDKKTYTREGYDVDIAARIPRLEWAKARIGYYNFKGEFGDEDETGLRGGLDLSPGEGVVFGVEYDGEDGSFGGNISYTHTFGETQQGAQRTGDFNPRAHFYDSVRREYSQRISRAEGGGGGLVIVGTGASVQVRSIDTATTATATVTVGVTANIVNSSVFPLVGDVIVNKENNGEATMMHQGGAWHLTLSSATAEVAFLGGTVMRVASGMGSFNRTGGGINEVVIAGTRITLLGTRFDFNADGNITLYEGGLSMAAATGLNIEVADNATVQVSNMVVRCGGGDTVTEVTANCGISLGGFGDPSSGINGTVTAGTGDAAVGLFTLSSTDGVMATTETPGFYIVTTGGLQLVIRQTTAAQPMPEPIIANMIISADLQTTRTVLFSVVVNPQPLAVSYVGGGTPNLNPQTVGAGVSIAIATMQINGGYADSRRIEFVGDGGSFVLTDGTLILGGDNTGRRAAAATIRGRDQHGTETNTLFVTVSVNATPPPPTPMCMAGSNCRTFSVTAHGVANLMTAGITTGSVNWRFKFGERTVQTAEKVLATLYDNSGLTLTITDEQVRGMLGDNDKIVATIISGDATRAQVLVSTRLFVHIGFDATRSIVVSTYARIRATVNEGVQTGIDYPNGLNLRQLLLADGNDRRGQVVTTDIPDIFAVGSNQNLNDQNSVTVDAILDGQTILSTLIPANIIHIEPLAGAGGNNALSEMELFNVGSKAEILLSWNERRYFLPHSSAVAASTRHRLRRNNVIKPPPDIVS